MIRDCNIEFKKCIINIYASGMCTAAMYDTACVSDTLNKAILSYFFIFFYIILFTILYGDGEAPR